MIVLLIGKSASGKDAILKRLVSDGTMQKIITYTTRPKREGEVNGIDYNFVSEQTFFDMVQQGKFFETRNYNTIDISGNGTVWYYGSELMNSKTRVPYISIVDVQGARDYIATYGKENVFVVYIDASDDTRYKRAIQRGSFNQAEWERRMKDDTDKFDINKCKDIVDLTVNNDGDIRDSIFEIVYEFMNYNVKKYRDIGGILR